jgi:hypothetical protein
MKQRCKVRRIRITSRTSATKADCTAFHDYQYLSLTKIQNLVGNYYDELACRYKGSLLLHTNKDCDTCLCAELTLKLTLQVDTQNGGPVHHKVENIPILKHSSCRTVGVIWISDLKSNGHYIQEVERLYQDKISPCSRALNILRRAERKTSTIRRKTFTLRRKTFTLRRKPSGLLCPQPSLQRPNKNFPVSVNYHQDQTPERCPEQAHDCMYLAQARGLASVRSVRSVRRVRSEKLEAACICIVFHDTRYP